MRLVVVAGARGMRLPWRSAKRSLKCPLVFTPMAFTAEVARFTSREVD